MDIYLVGGIPTPLKNMIVKWGHYSQYLEKKGSKPPTSLVIIIIDSDNNSDTPKLIIS